MMKHLARNNNWPFNKHGPFTLWTSFGFLQFSFKQYTSIITCMNWIVLNFSFLSMVLASYKNFGMVLSFGNKSSLRSDNNSSTNVLDTPCILVRLINNRIVWRWIVGQPCYNGLWITLNISTILCSYPCHVLSPNLQGHS
jgi:hypothetical protein